MSDPLVWTAQAAAPVVIKDGLPLNRPLTAYQGDDFRLVFQLSILVTGASAPDSADLTGHVGLMQVRQAESRASAIVIEIPFIGDNLSDGWVTFYGDHDLMQSILPGTYHYDAQLTGPTGVVRTWLKGTFTVLPEVSTDEVLP